MSSPGRFASVAVASATGGSALLSFAIAVTTRPRSGPFCTHACLRYPYTDGVEFVPRDFLWRYPAVIAVLLLVPLTALLGQEDPPTTATSRTAGQVALAFASMAAATLAADYGLQLAVMQPSLDRGETDGLSLLSQYNPHGMFIGLEDVGYLLMSLAFPALAPLVGRTTRIDRALRWTFVAGGVLPPLLMVVLVARHGLELDYHFEVYALTICWLVLTGAGPMQAVRSGTRSLEVGTPGRSGRAPAA